MAFACMVSKFTAEIGLPWLVASLSYYSVVLLALVSFFLLRSLFQKDQVQQPVNWPLVGMLPSLLYNVHRLFDWSTDLLRANGCTLIFKGPWFSGMKMVFTCDPDNVAHVLSYTHFSNYPKGKDFTEILDIFGDGIFNADHASWKLQRKIGITHFRNMRFRHLVSKTSQEKVEKGLLPLLQTAAQQAKTLDLHDLFQRFTFDATCIFVFGVDPGCLSSAFPTIPFAKAVDDVNEAIVVRQTTPKLYWKLLKWLKIGHEKKLADARETIDQFIENQISVQREQLRAPTQTPNSQEEEPCMDDLLHLYMRHELKEEMGQLKSPSTFLRDTTLNALLAGRDTISVALAWFFWLLSKNPSVEAKILEELKAISANNGKKLPRVFGSEELGEAVYLQAALHESLRLFPPIPFNQKGVVGVDVLPSGHRVEPGMKILICLYSMARMEMIWSKDCSEFRPERWIDSENGTLRFDLSDKFMVFNAGPRTCLGKDITFTNMKVVVASLVWNFEVQVLKEQVVSPKAAITLQMKNGLLVKIRERVHIEAT